MGATDFSLFPNTPAQPTGGDWLDQALPTGAVAQPTPAPAQATQKAPPAADWLDRALPTPSAAPATPTLPTRSAAEPAQALTEADRAPGSDGVLGGLADLGRGVVAGLADIPSQWGKSAQFVQHQSGPGEAPIGGDLAKTLEHAEAWSPGTFRESQAGAQRGDDPFSLRGQAYEGGKALGTSTGMALAGAATGAALGSVIPVLGTAAGAVGGATLGFFGSIPMFGLSQGEETYQKVLAAQQKAGIPQEAAHQEALKAGWTNAAIEAGGEAVSDLVTAGMARWLPSGLKGGLVRSLLDNQGQLVPALKQFATRVAPTELATEMGQTVGQQVVESQYGAGEMPTVQDALQVVIPTLIMTTLTAGGAHGLATLQRAQAARTLANPEADPTHRAQAAAEVWAKLATQDPELATLWKRYTDQRIQANQPVLVDEDEFYRNWRPDTQAQSGPQDGGAPDAGSLAAGPGGEATGTPVAPDVPAFRDLKEATAWIRQRSGEVGKEALLASPEYAAAKAQIQALRGGQTAPVAGPVPVAPSMAEVPAVPGAVTIGPAAGSPAGSPGAEPSHAQAGMAELRGALERKDRAQAVRTGQVDPATGELLVATAGGSVAPLEAPAAPDPLQAVQGQGQAQPGAAAEPLPGALAAPPAAQQAPTQSVPETPSAKQMSAIQRHINRIKAGLGGGTSLATGLANARQSGQAAQYYRDHAPQFLAVEQQLTAQSQQASKIADGRVREGVQQHLLAQQQGLQLTGAERGALDALPSPQVAGQSGLSSAGTASQGAPSKQPLPQDQAATAPAGPDAKATPAVESRRSGKKAAGVARPPADQATASAPVPPADQATASAPVPPADQATASAPVPVAAEDPAAAKAPEGASQRPGASGSAADVSYQPRALRNRIFDVPLEAVQRQFAAGPAWRVKNSDTGQEFEIKEPTRPALWKRLATEARQSGEEAFRQTYGQSKAPEPAAAGKPEPAPDTPDVALLARLKELLKAGYAAAYPSDPRDDGLVARIATRLEKAIRTRDAEALEGGGLDVIDAQSKVLRSVFTEVTGVKLPRAQAGSRAAIAEWAAKPAPEAATISPKEPNQAPLNPGSAQDEQSPPEPVDRPVDENLSTGAAGVAGGPSGRTATVPGGQAPGDAGGLRHRAPATGLGSDAPNHLAGAAGNPGADAPGPGDGGPLAGNVRGGAIGAASDAGGAKAPGRQGERTQGPLGRHGDDAGGAGRPVGGGAGLGTPVDSGSAGDGSLRRGVADFRAEPQDLLRTGSWYETAARNVEIMELALRISTENRPATREEQALLARYVGFGAGAIRNALFPVAPAYAKREEPGSAFYPKYVAQFHQTRGHAAEGERWAALAKRLDALPEQWRAGLLQSTQYAHYTSPAVVRSIWSGLERLGFRGGKILEPGMGIGNFALLMPGAVKDLSAYSGIEMDPMTALIAKLLSPNQAVRAGDFIQAKLPKDFFDLAIGNPPFSSMRVTSDPEYAKQRFSLHDYFFAKSLDRVRPGGVLVFVTSRHTLDKQDSKARQWLAERADLLGAVRLPQTAFRDNAGTDVVTDVLFLRKREAGAAPAGAAWSSLAALPGRGEVLVNEYFAAHPEQILGRVYLAGETDAQGRRVNGLHPGDLVVVAETEGQEALEAAFAESVQRLPANVYSSLQQAPDAVTRQTVAADLAPTSLREGSVYLDPTGALRRVEDGAGVALKDQVKLSAKDEAWLRDYVGVRDAVREARLTQASNGDWESALRQLNQVYDAFVATHGPILTYREQQRTSTKAGADGEEAGVSSWRVFKNKRLWNLDYDAPLVTQLEVIKDDGTIVKGKFFSGRSVGTPVERRVETPADALAVSLDQHGVLNLDDIAQRLQQSREETIEALGPLIFEVPGAGWALADAYLSGEVRTKLDEAKAAAELDPRYQRNVLALEAVQPAPLGPAQVTVQLGAGWVPQEVVSEFSREVLDGPAVIYDERSESWLISETGKSWRKGSTTSEWGTPDLSVAALLDAVLNNKSLTISRTSVDPVTGKKSTATDAAATALANDAARKIRARFKTWVWTDSARAETLLGVYNQKFNNLANRQFDGSHLTLPGVSLRFALHPHQKRAIWRIIQTGNTYLAHAVGAGKTMEMIAAGMEQRRLGLIRKPMYVVPNHMLEQFSREFLETYPLANLLVADEDNFSKERRKQFVAASAMNNPDALIITHSAFKRLGMTAEAVSPIRNALLSEIEDALSEVGTDQDNRILRGRLEKQKEAVIRRFDGVQQKGQDSVIPFEDMGVDFLFVDEAHAHRKLDFTTNRQAKGIDSSGSWQALDLFIKTRWLERQRPGRSFVLASGTPVTNTVGELYSIQRFFAEDAMQKDGMATFDAWASLFGEMASDLERDAAGQLKPVERFAAFSNVPELMSRVRQFMDVLTSTQLGDLVKRPDLRGGKPRMVLVEPSPALNEYLSGELARELEASLAWKPSPGQPGNPNPVVAIINKARLASIDLRFVGGKEEAAHPSKLMVVADEIAREYQANRDQTYLDDQGQPYPIKGASQIVFFNLGLGAQAQRNRGFNARQAVTDRLVAQGVPADQIAWFEDATTDAQKGRIFADMRSGKKSILIGSAKKMGTGVNVQNRLKVLHYLDPPWYPADVEQPHGRLLRQGNQNAEGVINWYSTTGTYEATMWQMVARKQRFIDQALSGDPSLRRMEDVSESSQFAMAAALVSGDPRAVELAEAARDVDRYTTLRNGHFQAQGKMRSEQGRLTWQLDGLRKRIQTLEPLDDPNLPSAWFSDAIIGGERFTKRGEAGDALVQVFNARFPTARIGQRVDLGTLHNGAVQAYFVVRAGALGRVADLFAEVKGVAQPVYTDLTQLAAKEDNGAYLARWVSAPVELRRALQEARSQHQEQSQQLAAVRKRIGAPFEYAQELAEAEARLARIRDDLASEGKDLPADPSAATPIDEFATSIAAEDLASAATMDWEGGGQAARFSRSAPQASSAHVAKLTTEAQRLAERLNLRVPVRVVASSAQFPAGLRDEMQRQETGDTVQAAVYQNAVWVAADQIPSVNDLRAIVFGHEIEGHIGFRRLFGRQAASAAMQIWQAVGGDAGLRTLERRWGVDLALYRESAQAMRASGEWSAQDAAYSLVDELLAHRQAQGPGSLPVRILELLKVFVGAVRQALARQGFLELSKLSEPDLLYLLRQMRRAARSFGAPVPAGQAARPVFALLRDRGFQDDLVAQAQWLDTQARKLEYQGGADEMAQKAPERLARMASEWRQEHPRTRFHLAWHGSPKSFDRFSLDQIRSWDAVHSHGFGLYFADEQAVAEHYQQQAGADSLLFKGKPFAPSNAHSPEINRRITEIKDLFDSGYSPYRAVSAVANQVATDLVRLQNRLAEAPGDPALERRIRSANQALDFLYSLNRTDFSEQRGRLYQVELAPKPHQYLDWYSPLNRQTRAVQQQLKAAGLFDQPTQTGGQLYQRLASEQGGQEAASQHLAGAGIPGIRYRDNTLEGQDSGFNYVLFDDQDVKIEARFSRSGDARLEKLLAQYASVEGAPSQAELAEAVRQFREVERAHAAELRAHDEQGEALRAPNREPTRLSRDQWVWVRTPHFKERFGDFEISASRPLRSATTFAEAREAAARFQGAAIINQATGQVAVVTRNNLDKMLSRSAVHKSESLPDHLLAVANLDHLFGRAILGWSKADRNQDPNITAVHRFFAPLLIGSKARLVKLTVKEFYRPDQGTKIYSVETLEVKEASPVPEMVDADRADGSRLLTGPTGLIESMAESVRAFNPGDVSRDLDENGEPTLAGLEAHERSEIRFARRKSPEVLADLEAEAQALDQQRLEQAERFLAAAAPKTTGGKVKELAKDTLTAAYDWAPGALTLRQLAEVGAPYLPSISGLVDGMQQAQTARNQMQEEVQTLSERWMQISGPVQDQLGELMNESTMAQWDPTRENGGVAPFDIAAARKRIAQLTKLELEHPGERGPRWRQWVEERDSLKTQIGVERYRRANANRIQALWAELAEGTDTAVAAWQALPADGQTPEAWAQVPDRAKAVILYGDARDAYAKMRDRMEQAIIRRIEASELAGKAKQAAILQIRQEFEANRVTPYFPLYRRGKYFVAAKRIVDGKPQHGFFMYESARERRRDLPALTTDGWTITKQGAKSEIQTAMQEISEVAVADAIQEMKARLGPYEAARATDAMYQVYLQGLHSFTNRVQFIHRGKTPGYKTDQRRAFSYNMVHLTHQVARQEAIPTLSGAISEAERRVKELTTGADSHQVTRAALLLDEAKRRFEWIMNPQGSATANRLTALGFVWHLGLSPAAGLVNLTQVALVALPELAARYGFRAAAKALGAAFRQVAAQRLKHWKNRDQFGQWEGVSEEERRALQAWQAEGDIDVSQTHILMGLAETDSADYDPRVAKALEWAGMMFHEAEVLNRAATLLAGYRLAKAQGASHEEAIRTSAQHSVNAHFDYSNANRARWMQANWVKVLTLFKSYAEHMTFFLARAAFLSVKGGTDVAPGERYSEQQQARRRLAGALGMTGLFAGSLGMPLMSTLFGIANLVAAAFGDDDEPWDAETEFRSWLQQFGLAGAVADRGVLNALTGADIASRVGLDQLWLRDADRDLGAQGTLAHWTSQVLGPVAGIASDWARSADLLSEGHFVRAAESALPKVVRDLMKSGRYGAEGVKSLRGDALLEAQDLGPYALALQAMGFTPDQIRARWDTNAMRQRYEKRMDEHRRRLIGAHTLAVATGDEDGQLEARATIARYNQSEVGRTYPISRQSLLQSVRTYQRMREEAIDGIQIKPRLRPALEAVGVGE